ncbi:DUF1842 domain-containing protein [Paraburkholderia sp. JHI2823]|uniref:DUF1842 domain-containing protein n=1 Tax=Paraburkholderia sp. JHI2823 TaxID=3112960 RepID=UPI003170B0E9
MDQLYRVDGIAGHQGVPGAPIIHFSLLVNPPSGNVSGVVEVTQTTNPPLDVEVKATGTLYQLGSDPVNVVSLRGTYQYTLPPPAIGTILETFTALMLVDDKWNGHGDFKWGMHGVINVPVKSAP